MAPHTRLAAASIVAAFTIVCGPAVLAQTTVEAETWDDAISKIDCKYTSKNADGSFSVTGVIKVHGEVQHNPIINIPDGRVGKEMPGSRSFASQVVGS